MGTPVSIRRERQKLLTFNRIVHGIAPHYLQELLLPFYRPTHSYNLRNADNLKFFLYRKQEQFLTTIVFLHQLFSYGMDYHWKQNVLNLFTF